MQKELIILPDDRRYAEARIVELEKAIQALGPEFYDVFNQSSETWHDNAPFDALRDRQSVLDAELQQLRKILRSSSRVVPRLRKNTVGIGSKVTLQDGKRYLIAGDWTPFAGQQRGEHVVISCQAPLGTALMGQKLGSTITLGRQTLAITAVE